MDLVRAILLAMEADADPRCGNFDSTSFGERQPDEIAYHVILMEEAGLIRAMTAATRGQLQAQPLGLTWTGHEFIDATRDPTLWAKVKGAASEAGGVSFDVLKATAVGLAVATAKRALGVG